MVLSMSESVPEDEEETSQLSFLTLSVSIGLHRDRDGDKGITSVGSVLIMAALDVNGDWVDVRERLGRDGPGIPERVRLRDCF